MADIEGGGDGGHKKGPGVKKAKKLSTRVDMTPMVDLGFLLITFFIFTTTLSTPTTMALNVPKKVQDEKNNMEVKASNALTILLGKDRGIFYYMGQLEPDGSNFQSSTFNDIRKVIIDKRKEVISRHIHDDGCKAIQDKAGDPDACKDKDFVVVIKPNSETTYASTIDALDEMTINGVKAFAMVDITPGENSLIQATQAADASKKK